MKRLLLPLAMLTAALLLLIWGCAKQPATTETPVDAATALARSGEMLVSTDEIRDQIEHLPAEIREQLFKKPDIFQKFVADAVLMKVLIGEARGSGLADDTEFQYKLREAEKEILFLRYREYWLERNVSISDSEIQNFYLTHPEEFKSGEMVKVRAWGGTNESQAQRALAALRTGAPIDEVMTRFNLRESPMQQDAYEIAQAKTDPVFARFIMPLKDGQFSEVIPFREKFVIFQRVGTLPARNVPLEEARERIAAYLKNDRAKPAFEGYIDSLRTQHQVDFNAEQFKVFGMTPVPTGAPTLPGASPVVPGAPAAPAVPPATGSPQ